MGSTSIVQPWLHKARETWTLIRVTLFMPLIATFSIKQGFFGFGLDKSFVGSLKIEDWKSWGRLLETCQLLGDCCSANSKQDVDPVAFRYGISYGL